jgi:hypothetical protein
MGAPNNDGTNNPQTVTGGQFGVVIDGSALNQNNVPAGTQVLGPITFDSTLSTTGNITANYFIGNGSLLTSITGANVTGQVGNALVAGTVYTNAQPNITSVGTLSSLSVSGNVNTGNLSITGNTILSASLAQAGGAPLAATDTTIAFKMPITIDGNVFYISLTAAQ